MSTEHSIIRASGPWENIPLYGKGVLNASANAERSNGNLVVPGYTISDCYGILICLIIAPIGIIFYIVFMIYMLPIFIILRIYIAMLSSPKPRIDRGCFFQLFSFILFLICFPLILLVFIYLFLTLIVITLPASIIYSFLSCNICNFCKNMTVLKESRKLGHWSWNDILVTIIGQINRQGVLKLLLHFPCVCIVVPILKYVFVVNPLLYKLSEKFTNQWTASIPLNDATIVSSLIKSVSWTIEDDATRFDIRDDDFSANYPFPPANFDHEPRPVVGIQVMSIVNFTYSIHNIHNVNVRSTTAKRGIFRVPLYFYNPFHIMTGYVEVNLQHQSALEHPMWCITGNNHLGNQFYKNANLLFWKYAPEVASDLQNEPLNA
ncbi:hypothetical protein THRCLA_22603 [Thraustotheca clavata]|uniref:Transmembrane protein n=1 Tax=Thraustotheca clavata TaxID=74557 RepID=A0A1V9YWD0_9STRA|nr:hypothetical protein THRCLA_22603 [Thraustotheca clavata]